MTKITYLELGALTITELICLNFGININILKSTGTNSWLVVILAYLIGIIPLSLLIYISNYEKELTLKEKINKLFGKYIGTFINIIISIILFIIGITILYNINSFTTSQFLYRTPIIISTTLLVILIVYNTNKGLNSISRMSQLLIIISFILFLTTFFSLTKDTNLNNFLPLFKSNTSNILKNSIKISIINILPLITILCIPKDRLIKEKLYNKTIIISYIIGFISLMIIVINTYGVLGEYLANIFEYPEYMLLKKIKLFGFLERIENVVSVKWIITSYIYLTIILYNIGSNIINPPNKSFKNTNIIIGILFILSTNLLFKNNASFNQYINNIFPYIVSILLIIYILLTIKIFISKKKSAII